MRILAIDLGDESTGLAISDQEQLFAQPLNVIRQSNWGEIIKELREIVVQYQVSKIVIGVPRTLSDKESLQTKKTLNFVERLKQELALPIIEWEEGLTTIEAEGVLIEGRLSRKKRKRVVDKIAACLILESYLNKQKEKK